MRWAVSRIPRMIPGSSRSSRRTWRKSLGALPGDRSAGGMAPALESGFFQEEIDNVAQARARRIAHGQLELTGVSAFPLLAADGVSVAPHPVVSAIVRGGTAVAPLPPRRLAEPSSACAMLPISSCSCRPTPAGVPGSARRDGRALGAHHLDEELPGRRRHRGRREYAAHTSADTGKAFADSDTHVACICSSDAIYAELAGGDRRLAQDRRCQAGSALPDGPGLRRTRSALPALMNLCLPVAMPSRGSAGCTRCSMSSSSPQRSPRHSGGCQCGAVRFALYSTRSRSASATVACARRP